MPDARVGGRALKARAATDQVGEVSEHGDSLPPGCDTESQYPESLNGLLGGTRSA
jgi:hypothetical protein